MKGDGLTLDSVAPRSVYGSHDEHPDSRVHGCGHQEVLVLEEIVELCLEIGAAPDTILQRLAVLAYVSTTRIKLGCLRSVLNSTTYIINF